MQRLFPAEECADEHYESALRQVEVRDEPVDNSEFVAGVDEDPGILGEYRGGGPGERRSTLVRLGRSEQLRFDAGGGFQRAAGGSSDGYHAAAVCFAAPYFLGGYLRDGVVLHMHLVVENIVLLDRTEGAKPDVQGDVGGVNALIRELSEYVLGEVKPGGGGGGGAGFPAVDRVVSVLILELLGDVGRKRHLTYPVENVEEMPLKGKADHAVAIVNDVQYLGGKSLGEIHDRAGLQALSGVDEGLPLGQAQPLQQKEFNVAAAAALRAVNTRREHLAVVHDEQVAGAQVLIYIVEVIMGDLSRGAVYCHQPGAVPWLHRGLGDELLRQVVVEIGFKHCHIVHSFIV